MRHLIPIRLSSQRPTYRESFDFDNDHFIKPEDIVRSFTSIGEEITLEQAEEMINKHDSDHHFKIGLEEFKQMLL